MIYLHTYNPNLEEELSFGDVEHRYEDNNNVHRFRLSFILGGVNVGTQVIGGHKVEAQLEGKNGLKFINSDKTYTCEWYL